MSDNKNVKCKTKYMIASPIDGVFQNSRHRIKDYDSKDNGNHILYEGDRKPVALINPIPEKCSSYGHKVIQCVFLQKHHR